MIPMIYCDCPDPDIIRVDDTYYMVCTTKHFLPGGSILMSKDLKNWKLVSHLFERFESAERQTLSGEASFYGYGMENGSIRYHNGMFYVAYCGRGMDYTYLFTSKSIEGPWERKKINQMMYGCSLLFDDDGKIYMVYGFKKLYVQEMNDELTGYKVGGLFKQIYEDKEDAYVNACGCRVNKINGRYYVGFVRWPKVGERIRTHYVYSSDRIDGEYTGGAVLIDDNGFFGQGVAQGGFVDTPDGKWYGVFMQDHGAVGRIPVLVPVKFENNVPVFDTDSERERIAKGTEVVNVAIDNGMGKVDSTLCGSDDFVYEYTKDGKVNLAPKWQWNHEPNDACWWQNDGGGICLKSGKVSINLVHTQNILTQRCTYPKTTCEVTVDARYLKDGDMAGLCILQGCYGCVGIAKELNQYFIKVVTKEFKKEDLGHMSSDYMPGNAVTMIPIDSPNVTLRISADFTDMNDVAEFAYKCDGEFVDIGKKHNLYFKIDHFTGARVGMFMFCSREIGGHAIFTKFKYNE